MATDIEEALDRCISELQGGAAAGDCLRSYPDKAGELEPLLRTATLLKTVASASNGQAKARVWASVEQSIHRQLRRRRQFVPVHLFSSTFAKAAVATVLLIGISVTAVRVSADELPGSPLYPLKRGLEYAQLSLTFDQMAKVEMKMALIERRLDELTKYSAVNGRVDEGILRAIPGELSRTIDDIGNLPAADRALLAGELHEAWQQREPAMLELESGQGSQVREGIEELRSIAKRAETLAEGPSDGPGDSGDGASQTPSPSAETVPASPASPPSAVPSSTPVAQETPVAEPRNTEESPAADDGAEREDTPAGEHRETDDAATPGAAKTPEEEERESGSDGLEVDEGGLKEVEAVGEPGYLPDSGRLEEGQSREDGETQQEPAASQPDTYEDEGRAGRPETQEPNTVGEDKEQESQVSSGEKVEQEPEGTSDQAQDSPAVILTPTSTGQPRDNDSRTTVSHSDWDQGDRPEPAKVETSKPAETYQSRGQAAKKKSEASDRQKPVGDQKERGRSEELSDD